MSTSINRLLTRYASHSSSTWLGRQNKDTFVKLSRYHNYRSRAAFKLIQIDDKYRFLKPGINVIDVGAAPGSWTQVICERVGLGKMVGQKISELEKPDGSKEASKEQSGMCIALDLRKIEPVDGAICLSNVDFTSPFTQSKLLEWLEDRKVDCVLSDMSPDVSGQKDLDHERSMELNHKLSRFAVQVLREKSGVMVAKVLDGNERRCWTEQLEKIFESVKVVKPEASRLDSREVYVLCRRFRG